MWKANGKTTTLLLFLDSLFQKQRKCEMLPLVTKQSGGKLLSHSQLRGGGVFLGETPHGRSYSEEYRQKQKTQNEHHTFRIGTYPVSRQALSIFKV
jgi:hypothetical protein